MSDDEYTPLIDREREHESRIHEELTEPARERLAVITEDVATDSRTDAMEYLLKRVGKSPIEVFLKRNEYGNLNSVRHDKFILNGKTQYILTYIEILLKEYHIDVLQSNAKSYSESMEISANPEEFSPLSATVRVIKDIEDVLITEGILYDIQRIGEGGVIQFTPLESDGMKELDEELREVAEKQPWGEALKGYNDAFDRYLSGDFDEHIPKKLYYSIEEVMKTICVDKEEWTDNRELTHADYIEMLKENGVYDAHGVTATELSDLLDSLERMVAKVSDERHQRHAYHDRTYATLLIHQVGSYLYFLINRYEDYDS
jgi:hypothetical protein